MPPNTLQTVRNYSNALGFAPSPGFPARWPPGTGPRRTATQRRHSFAGPLKSPAIKFAARRAGHHAAALHGLGDGEGLGDWTDDLLNLGKSAVNSVAAPVTDQLTELKTALKIIVVLSGIAAGTGLLGMIRR
jgi:hypothetical protein